MKTANGRNLKEMLEAATSWLEKSVSYIDALNVFPVPDGDTGTNMLLTMRACVNAASDARDGSASEVAGAIARGALIGARGNSGVILSQFWQGLAVGLRDKESFGGKDFARALKHSSELAYKGVSHPVEGTILTVIKDIAATAERTAANGDCDLESLLETCVRTARESVSDSPNLLAVLKEAGVVDAGGQGLYTILDGALRFLQGGQEQMREESPEILSTNIVQGAAAGSEPAEELFGYCTEFLLSGDGLDVDAVRSGLEEMGTSLVVVGGGGQIRVHIHTEHPGAAIQRASAYGDTHHVSIRNMEEQHRAYEAMRNHTIHNHHAPASNVSVVAVTLGDGLAEVFASLGATAVIAGGQTMNPSTGELAEAVDSVPSKNVILLPNNKNVLITANQVQAVTDKNVAIVPSVNIPQGVAALIAYHQDEDIDANVASMQEAIGGVETVEVIPAVRNATFGGFQIRRGQAMGFLEGELVAVDDRPGRLVETVLAGMQLGRFELVTLYRGADVGEAEARELLAELERRYPKLQFELIYGGQPFSSYIVSVE